MVLVVLPLLVRFGCANGVVEVVVLVVLVVAPVGFRVRVPVVLVVLVVLVFALFLCVPVVLVVLVVLVFALFLSSVSRHFVVMDFSHVTIIYDHVSREFAYQLEGAGLRFKISGLG